MMEQHDDTKNTGSVDSYKTNLLQKTLHPIAEEYKDRDLYLELIRVILDDRFTKEFQHELWNNPDTAFKMGS